MLSGVVDNGALSALYSQLTGVLAGLSFTTLIFLLDGRRRRDETPSALDDAIAYMIFCAFVGLAVSSLTYSVIGGDLDAPRAALEHVVAAPGFTASGLNLVFVTYALFVSSSRSSAQERAAPSRAARAITAAGAPLVGLIFTLSGSLPIIMSGLSLTSGFAVAAFLVGAGGSTAIFMWLTYKPHRYVECAGVTLGTGAIILSIGSAAGTIAVNAFTAPLLANRAGVALTSLLVLAAYIFAFCLISSRLPLLVAHGESKLPREPTPRDSEEGSGNRSEGDPGVE